ncbi:MAG: molybdopterin-dependent oxidoreductase [Actinomycetota bacterium]|nr:molybdopterin-dependent oxidoreductase [Actinomycetota bacterium]
MTGSGKHPDLAVWSDEPFNAETPPELLARSQVTPTELFYVRNHGRVPEPDGTSYRLSIEGMVGKPLTFSLDELAASFPETTVEATLVCAGNRRRELAAVRPIPGEMPWGAGAIGNAVWTGVRLGDVLLAAEVEAGARHVAFTGLDEAEGQHGRFGGSIPLEKATSGDVVLAFAMNGEPLQPLHGFPLRVVVPGYIGARSVKWLSTITVQARPSSNYFHARAYRLLPPEPAGDGRAPGASLPLGELSVTSALCRVGDGRAQGKIVAEGYAIAGGTRTVERVDVSLDDGKTWALARLGAPGRPNSWRLWRSELDVAARATSAVVRAWDSAANSQPEEAASIWNPMGYVNNAWHRVRLLSPTG